MELSYIPPQTIDPKYIDEECKVLALENCVRTLQLNVLAWQDEVEVCTCTSVYGYTCVCACSVCVCVFVCVCLGVMK